jgi:hypothetical protein
MTGQGAVTGGTGSTYGQGSRNYGEDRGAYREQTMNNIRESSQQDRRVYVGNLSYDVKWHHLKDFMRTGELRAFVVVSAMQCNWTHILLCSR